MPAGNRVQQGGLRVRLVVPGNVHHNSGGNVYNASLARELAALGVDVEICPLDGAWPVGSAADRQRLAALLDGGEDARSGRPITLVDGLLACGAPDELEAAAAAGRPAWILLHMPLDDAGHGEAGLERRAPRSEPPHFLAVAALLPNKDQTLLLAALSALPDVPWTASLVGSDTADPSCAALLRDTVKRLGLQDRVRIPGELRGPALEAEWAAADLSLFISRAETFGLVVTESIAHGVPTALAGCRGGRPGPSARPGRHGPDRAGRPGPGASGRAAGGCSAGIACSGRFPCRARWWTMTP